MEQPNLSYIKELSGGDASFEEKLINVVKNELPDEIVEYQNNIEIENYKLAAENVHKLKHKFGIVGLEKSYQVAIDYEAGLLEGNLDLKEEFEAILQLIHSFINEL
ncbi:Hpt domain-containing protein [Patiriisocius marinus]|uniref:Histidine kinase n=1 Tax=Patiriisocius marinus TaxID=1397112 RepID=A0A5J4IYK3_9FLAO|nr:Hpt domain-containing protein [Patiriisocius marinus]GER60016.1 histidine kinase [Patiriisocius marinus]